MSESIVKAASASPVARAGAGDLSERELGRERRALCATPPNRMHRGHPKKLFSTPAPVSKFTGGVRAISGATSPQLLRLRSCLDEYRRAAPASEPPTPAEARAKATSLEDLTPSKRVKKESSGAGELEVRPRGDATLTPAQAAARIGRFMVVAAWRRRRGEALALRRALDSKRSSAERLRAQVWALRSLLDADNGKVVLAMRELERLKRLLRDRDAERAVLEREKQALEKDLSAVEDRASEFSIGWRNSRNELQAVRDALQRAERERAAERTAAADARAHRDRAYARINLLEEELTQREALLASSEAEAASLRREAEARDAALRLAGDRLRQEAEARSQSAVECRALQSRASLAEREACALRERLAGVERELAEAERELAVVREQLGWWPRPLTRMLGAARSLFRHPMSLPEAVMWSLMPSRHGCY